MVTASYCTPAMQDLHKDALEAGITIVNEVSTHCLKLKMIGKKLSWFQFHFPGLLETLPMLKQETFFFFFFYNWTSEIIPLICFVKQIDRT